jgi:hypothetical protein
VLLSAPNNAVLDDATGTGTILDDDVTLAGKRKATFTEADGDLVTIAVSKGVLKVEDFTLFPSGSGSQLALVDFSGESEFAGANLSITAKKAGGSATGNGRVDVGAIEATGVDLGKVRIKGDLGQIDSGDEADRRPGVLALSATSLGQRGLATQLPGGSLQSDIAGTLKTLALSRDLQDAALSVSGDIRTITIKGSMLGGAIRSDGKIGAIKIGGDLAARAATEGSGASEALISALGTLAPASGGKALAIRSVSIGGSVDHAQILAGYDRTGAAVNADVQIGAVSVKRDWIASSLVAGATAGTDGFFGSDGGERIAGTSPIIAKIASILIKGAVRGTEAGGDHFGFVAEQVGSFKLGGAKLPLTRGAGNDLAGLPAGTSGDVLVREVA